MIKFCRGYRIITFTSIITFPLPAAKPEPKFFNGMSVAFEAASKNYVMGWDERVTKEEAEAKCGSIGANLARIYSDEKLGEVK
jgi:hypothetical protein